MCVWNDDRKSEYVRVSDDCEEIGRQHLGSNDLFSTCTINHSNPQVKIPSPPVLRAAIARLMSTHRAQQARLPQRAAGVCRS